MGASGDRFMVQHREFRVDTAINRWLEFSYAIAGSAPRHDGCSICTMHDGATLLDDAPGLGAHHAIISGAFQAISGAGLGTIDSAFAALTTAPTDGPWPGVKPCDWWAGQTDKMAWCQAIAAKMRDHDRAL